MPKKEGQPLGRLEGRSLSDSTDRWKKAGELVILLARVCGALVVLGGTLYGAIGGCGHA